MCLLCLVFNTCMIYHIAGNLSGYVYIFAKYQFLAFAELFGRLFANCDAMVGLFDKIDAPGTITVKLMATFTATYTSCLWSDLDAHCWSNTSTKSAKWPMQRAMVALMCRSMTSKLLVKSPNVSPRQYSIPERVGGIPVCSGIAVLNGYRSGIYLYVCRM